MVTKITRSLIQTIINHKESVHDRSTIEDMEDILDTFNSTVSWLISRGIRGKYKINLEDVTEETKNDILDNFIYLIVHHKGTTNYLEIYDYMRNIGAGKILKEEYKHKNDFDILKELQILILDVLDYYVNDNYLEFKEKDVKMEKIMEIISIFILELFYNKE